METKDIILEILKALEKSLDDETLSQESVSAEKLGITTTKRNYILQMMQDEGIIKGVIIDIGNKRAPANVRTSKIEITLKGIMYLDENTTTAKIIKAAKLLKDTIPMI